MHLFNFVSSFSAMPQEAQHEHDVSASRSAALIMLTELFLYAAAIIRIMPPLDNLIHCLRYYRCYWLEVKGTTSDVAGSRERSCCAWDGEVSCFPNGSPPPLQPQVSRREGMRPSTSKEAFSPLVRRHSIASQPPFCSQK